jgi:hypothetical protein
MAALSFYRRNVFNIYRVLLLEHRTTVVVCQEEWKRRGDDRESGAYGLAYAAMV